MCIRDRLKRSLDVLGGHSPLAMLGGAAISALWAATGFFLARRHREMAGRQDED